LISNLHGLRERVGKASLTRERAGVLTRAAEWRRAVATALSAIHTLDWPWKIALGAAVCAPWIALRLAIFGFGPQFPYLMGYPGVAMAAALGGAVTGLGATLTCLICAPLWYPPSGDLDFVLRFGGFLFYSASICGLAWAMYRALWRLGEAEGRCDAAEKLLIASEKLRLASAGAIGTFDLDVLANTANDAESTRAIFGLPPGAEVNPDAVIGLALPEDRPAIRSALAAAFQPAGDGLYQAEYRIRRASDGAERWISTRGQVYFSGGRPTRMIGVASDVTDVKSAERVLQNGQAQIRLFVESAPIDIAMFDREMNYLAASRRWIENFGKGREDIVGLNHYQLHPDLPERWKAVHRLVLKGEFHSNDDDCWIDDEGRTRYLRWVTYPWMDASGAIGGLVISAEDVTAHRQAVQAVRDSEEKFRSAFAGAAIGFVMAEAGGQILEANSAFCRLTGYRADELKGMRALDLVHIEERGERIALENRMADGETPGYVIETRYLRKDGGTIWVRESASLSPDAGGDRRWVVKLVEDVTARKRIEESAARTVAQLTAVLDGAKDAIIAIDIRGVVQSINAAGERMFGYEREEVIGRNVRMLMPDEDARRHDGYIANYLRTGVGKIIGIGREAEGRRKDGGFFPIDLSVVEAAVHNELMFVGFVRDLSERRRIESRIDQLAAQRLSAIGGMAGALAHELNQPLAAASVYLETARRLLQRPADQRPASADDAIGRAADQITRMGAIIRHLREFVAHGEPDKTHQSLHALIREVASAEFPEDKVQRTQLTLDLRAERDNVLMDRVQIGQVLSNLVRNAREAVADSSGWRVVVTTSLVGDAMIRCGVSDDGPGVADAVRERLFEPLTSTKATGMGVGLSISKSIIEAHYGRIWAEPSPFGGAAFSFTLPLTVATSEE
jgi:PAS domain S-box-containing protein